MRTVGYRGESAGGAGDFRRTRAGGGLADFIAVGINDHGVAGGDAVDLELQFLRGRRIVFRGDCGRRDRIILEELDAARGRRDREHPAAFQGLETEATRLPAGRFLPLGPH